MQLISTALLLVLPFISSAAGLRFTIPAGSPDQKPRCISDYVPRDTLVVVTIKTNGFRGDGQILNAEIFDDNNNEYGKPKDIEDTRRIVFNPVNDGNVNVCLRNFGSNGVKPGLEREVELSVEIGAEARDWQSIQANEKLKPSELRLRKVEDILNEVERSNAYLKARETRLRDTNESTNERVKYFSTLIILSFIGLGVWQIIYLRQYFRSKHII